MRFSSSLVLLLIVTGACGGGDQRAISNRQATEVVESGWQSRSTVCLPIGEFQVVRGRADPAERQIPVEVWSIVEKLASTTLLDATVKQDLTRRFSGWERFRDLTQKGILKLVSIELGPMAGEAGQVVTNHRFYPGIECLELELEKYSIEEIIQNEPAEHPVERFRLISGLHTAEPTALGVVLAELLDEPLEGGVKKRKFRALLKFDPFDERWKLETSDIADREAEFSSKKVQQALD